MFFYKFANIYLGIDYDLADFRAFSVDESDVDDNECIMVELSEEKVQRQSGRSVLRNDYIKICRVEEESFDGWVMEDVKERGCLTVTRDYKNVVYSCKYERTNSGYYEYLKYLLLFVIQCRMTYTGLLILHAACIQVNGKAICFSGPSGVGKSTRAKLWVDYKNAAWISGDRPAVAPRGGIAYGVPWDGKEQIHVKENYPILEIFEVSRSADTCLQELTRRQKYEFLSAQLFIPMWDTKLAATVFCGMKTLIDNVKIHRLHCDITEESLDEVYHLTFGLPDGE